MKPIKKAVKNKKGELSEAILTALMKFPSQLVWEPINYKGVILSLADFSQSGVPI